MCHVIEMFCTHHVVHCNVPLSCNVYALCSIKRSVPVLKAEDGGGGGGGGGRLTDDDVALLQLQLDGRADATGTAAGGRGARERQLSITSLGDSPCCAVS